MDLVHGTLNLELLRRSAELLRNIGFLKPEAQDVSGHPRVHGGPGDLYSDRVKGCFLGGMCGDVLGACVEGWKQEKILLKYSKGLTEFQATKRGYGRYTDDTNMTIALASSLLRKKGCDAEDCARSYEHYFEPGRGYGSCTTAILEALRSRKASYLTTATMRNPQGSYANGGAMRIAPVGLAFRHASMPVMREAVRNALRCTHVHPWAIDAAVVQAACVSFLCKCSSEHLPMHELLDHLASLCETTEMRGKLITLTKGLQQLPVYMHVPATKLEQHFKSQEWKWACQLALQLGEPFQIKAPDCMAVSLMVFLLHWRDPVTAVVCAVHLGGDTDTVAAMVGALCGALHGSAWIPASWLSNLEDGRRGKGHVMQLAERLAALDLRDVSSTHPAARVATTSGSSLSWAGTSSMVTGRTVASSLATGRALTSSMVTAGSTSGAGAAGGTSPTSSSMAGSMVSQSTARSVVDSRGRPVATANVGAGGLRPLSTIQLLAAPSDTGPGSQQGLSGPNTTAAATAAVAAAAQQVQLGNLSSSSSSNRHHSKSTAVSDSKARSLRSGSGSGSQSLRETAAEQPQARKPRPDDRKQPQDQKQDGKQGKREEQKQQQGQEQKHGHKQEKRQMEKQGSQKQQGGQVSPVESPGSTGAAEGRLAAAGKMLAQALGGVGSSSWRELASQEQEKQKEKQ